MKSVLISIQPYYVFLIIAKAMGWSIDKEKTIELRTTRPKDKNWNNLVEIYCSKNKKSFNQIPKEYQPLMQRFLGKVVGKWLCNKIDSYVAHEDNKDYWDLSVKEWEDLKQKSCLTIPQILEYSEHSDNLYGWHITDLKIYDKPKELSKFIKPFKYDGDGLICGTEKELNDIYEWDCETLFNDKYPNFDFENCKCEDCPKAKVFYRLKLAPQSWCYVESGV